MNKWIMLALLAALTTVASAESVNGVAFNKVAAATAFTQSVDVGDFKSLSFQVDYASQVPTSISVAGGSLSSVTFRVADYAGLHGQASSATVTLVAGHNAANIVGSNITINGHAFAIDASVYSTVYATLTAYNLGLAIDAYPGFSATTSSNVITVTADAIGTAANSWTITSSTAAFTISPFSTGQNYGYLFINGTTLTEGTDWTAATSSDTTAASIATAINGNAALAALVLASTSTALTKGYVQVVANNTGLNAYPLSVSNAAKLVPNFYTFNGGVATAINIAADTFTKAAHGLTTGMGVLFSTGNAKTVTGLTNQTTYYAIPIDANTFKLASTAANALAGTAIDITATQDGATHTLAPIAFTKGSAGFEWRGSNDGVTFYSLPLSVSVGSVTYASPSGQLFTFTDYAYRYLQMNYTGPTWGGININAVVSGRK